MSRSSFKKLGKLRSIFSQWIIKKLNPLEIFNNWWTYPMNGQARRIFNVNALASCLRPTVVIETGTYLGSSTWFFFGIPTVKKVYSIESNAKYHFLSKRRLQGVFGDRLSLILGDSKAQFSLIIQDLNPGEETLLAYLDAHWEGDIPTTSELAALCSWGGNWCAVVDDFKVSDETLNGYGYDVYAKSAVDSSIIPSDFELFAFVPNESESQETGARRGTAYIMNAGARKLLPKGLLEDLKLQSL